MNTKNYTVLDYLGSHKQHSLNPALTPEQITERLGGIKPRTENPDNDYDEGGDKVSYQWDFYVSEGFAAPFTLACSIWDYKGSRWSAYGPRAVFEELGLL